MTKYAEGLPFFDFRGTKNFTYMYAHFEMGNKLLIGFVGILRASQTR